MVVEHRVVGTHLRGQLRGGSAELAELRSDLAGEDVGRAAEASQERAQLAREGARGVVRHEAREEGVKAHRRVGRNVVKPRRAVKVVDGG